jgi:ATP adenylyltransferase
VKRLWAPWRMAYVGGAAADAGCLFCTALASTDDARSFVVRRRPGAFLILNAYPYTPGHLMAVPNRHVATLAEATAEEVSATMALAAEATRALVAEYRAEGFNIGINQGRVAGAGVEGHLHVHVVPRWNGDTNFMTAVGEARVLPEALSQTWRRLRDRLGD